MPVVFVAGARRAARRVASRVPRNARRVPSRPPARCGTMSRMLPSARGPFCLLGRPLGAERCPECSRARAVPLPARPPPRCGVVSHARTVPSLAGRCPDCRPVGAE
eukprot:4663408-Prymnesium_polylepis.1